MPLLFEFFSIKYVRMSAPSIPIINVKPKASLDKLEFWWQQPNSTGVNYFDPLNLSSLLVWIDSTDAETLTIINNNDVRQVTDKVNGTTFTPIQNPSGRFLQSQTRTINNIPGLWFNNQFADNVFLQGSTTLPASGAAFIVFKAQDQFTPAWRALFGSNTVGCSRLSYINGRENVLAPGISYSNVPGTPQNTLVPETDYLLYYSWEGLTTKVGLFGAVPTAGLNPINITQSGSILRIGKDTNLCTNMTLGEFMLVDSTLATRERQLVEGYLAWKWGLQTQLPVNHPYWNNDPRSGPSPLQGYTLSCPTLPFVSTFPASTNYTVVNAPAVALDYQFNISAFNLNGTGPPAYFMVTEQGILPTSPVIIEVTQTDVNTVNVTWTFDPTNPLEAITKWFVITARPALNPLNAYFRSAHGSERSRPITNLPPDVYTITIQAVNDVGYSYITEEATASINLTV